MELLMVNKPVTFTVAAVPTVTWEVPLTASVVLKLATVDAAFGIAINPPLTVTEPLVPLKFVVPPEAKFQVPALCVTTPSIVDVPALLMVPPVFVTPPLQVLAVPEAVKVSVETVSKPVMFNAVALVPTKVNAEVDCCVQPLAPIVIEFAEA